MYIICKLNKKELLNFVNTSGDFSVHSAISYCKEKLAKESFKDGDEIIIKIQLGVIK